MSRKSALAAKIEEFESEIRFKEIELEVLKDALRILTMPIIKEIKGGE